jgi:hypothetical protein
MAERDEIYHPQFVRCPECLRRNMWDAVECRHCGTLMPSQQPEAPKVKDVKKAAQTEMVGLKAYAVITFALALIIALVSLVAGVIMLLSADSQPQGMLMIVAGFALTVIHVIMGRGLWLERTWAKRGALQMHAVVVIFFLVTILVHVFGANIRALQYLTDPVVLLALIGMLALWVGVGAEEGERLAVNGPDPTSVEMIMQHNDVRPGSIITTRNTGPYPQRAHLPDGPLIAPIERTIAGNGYTDPKESREKEKEQAKMMMSAAMLAFSAFKGVLGRRRDSVAEEEPPRKTNGSRWTPDEPEPAPKKRASTKRSTRKRKNNGDDDMGFIGKFLRG